jgi:hypothetical protein
MSPAAKPITLENIQKDQLKEDQQLKEDKSLKVPKGERKRRQSVTDMNVNRGHWMP